MKVLLILGLLLFKHYIADFVLQTKYQYLHKRYYGHMGGIIHALLHAVGTALVLLIFFRWQLALLAALCDGLIHYHVDWLKEKTTLYFKATPETGRFWMILGADQLIHQLTYIGIIYMLIYSSFVQNQLHLV